MLPLLLAKCSGVQDRIAAHSATGESANITGVSNDAAILRVRRDVAAIDHTGGCRNTSKRRGTLPPPRVKESNKTIQHT